MQLCAWLLLLLPGRSCPPPGSSTATEPPHRAAAAGGLFGRLPCALVQVAVSCVPPAAAGRRVAGPACRVLMAAGSGRSLGGARSAAGRTPGRRAGRQRPARSPPVG